MNRGKKKICFIGMVVAGILLLGITVKGNTKTIGLQQGIAEEILRFHVIANSDTQEDQELKLKVKEAVVKEMKGLLADVQEIQETIQRVDSHLEDLENIAAQVVEADGYDYEVNAKLVKCYFPIKTYGDCTFPAGIYQALRICIGKAEGKNWWCVLYPNLCFVDSIHGIVPEEQKRELQQVLTEEEYDSLFDWKEKEFKITTKWFHWK